MLLRAAHRRRRMERGRSLIVVDVDNVSLVRQGTPILREVSWRIEGGRHSVLLGANGSGKTTLLKVITGYERPTSGRVEVLGKVYGECDLRAMRKAIGWVSNALEHRVPAHDTAARIAASGFDASLGLYRNPDQEEWARCHETLDELAVEHLAERPFGLLSQGEQKRVLIARALVHRPALLILDEPCAGLDPVARAAFLDDIGPMTVAPDAPTVVLVTHHLEEIAPWICDAIALNEGRVVARGSVDCVLTDDALSRVFGQACRVTREGAAYRMSLIP